jgi:hypothetical protein
MIGKERVDWEISYNERIQKSEERNIVLKENKDLKELISVVYGLLLENNIKGAIKKLESVS